MPEEYKNKLINLIMHERNFEEKEMQKKLIELLQNHESNGENTIRNISGRRIHKFPITVKFKKDEKINTDINELDTVLVSDENHPEKILKGKVYEKRSNSILVVFDNEKILEWGIPDKARIDLFVRDSEYMKMIENLNLYKQNPNVFMALQYALNNLNPPNKKRIKYINFYDKHLNKSQKRAVIRSLKSEDFFLIHGPFGTGKTTTLVELIRQEAKNHKVLVTADSNAAVDNIVERLMPTKLNITRIGNEHKINYKVRKATLNFKFKNHPKYKEISKNLKKIKKLTNKPNYDKFLINQLYAKNNLLKQEIESEIISESEIVLTTNSSSTLDVLNNVSFGVAVIDEASQTTIPKVLLPISKADKFILAGDHKQLPPTVKSKCVELEETLFKKLINNFPSQKQFLNIQHRMNETLMKFPNKKFYNNRLKCDKNYKNIKIDERFGKCDIESPLVFLDTKSLENNKEKQYENSTSTFNALEAKIASEIADKYLKLTIDKENVGIISLYNDQVDLIKKMIDVEVNTVDGFQGKEKEIIILSPVRSNDDNETGFINDQRINVALTRAKRKLIVIGNTETLKHHPTFNEFIKHCQNENCMINLTNMENIYEKN
ncbi:AAA domain-containing protein [uncultured Methanobrevibacter sp.]|uniref:AAA domain-containing protein n=1 Tax=uncultured Methanobrevibacter sp. TaxID=253161 RepID=UPI00260EB2B2|nr:AAA domain-containing protein [uncultured Methanobrevibacter sp.]